MRPCRTSTRSSGRRCLRRSTSTLPESESLTRAATGAGSSGCSLIGAASPRVSVTTRPRARSRTPGGLLGSGRSGSRPAIRFPPGGVVSTQRSAMRCSTYSTTFASTPERSSARWCPAACTTRSWVFTPSPLMAEWHHANVEELHLPELYDIDGVVTVFKEAGFDAAVSRLAIRFVPTAGRGHHGRGRLVDWLDYYCDQKLLLRF